MTPVVLDQLAEANARRRPCFDDLLKLVEKYDKEGNTVLEVGIHGDIYPGAHAFLFKKAHYATLDIDPYVAPTYVADIRDMPFDDESFDLIICHAVIEHVLERREKAYSELYRTLKKGGTVSYLIPALLDEREVEPARFVSQTQLRDCHEGLDYDFKMLVSDLIYMEVRK